jgi:predicted nucleotidyltransferase
LAKLEAVGLIRMKQSANQKLYQVNQKSHLFSELRSIVIKTFGLVDVLQEALKPIVSRIQIAFIYGSIAKHEDKVHSDIDLMLIGNDLSYAELYPLLERAQKKLGRQVNPTCYTSEEWARKQKEGNNFINQLIKQPKIFIKGTENDLI